MRKTTIFIAILLTASAVFGQRLAPKNPKFTTVKVDTVRGQHKYDGKYHAYQDNAIFKAGVLGDSAAVGGYTKFDLGESDTFAIFKRYSYVFFFQCDTAKKNKLDFFSGEFAIELHPNTEQFKQINISGDSTAVMQAIGRYAFLGSQIEAQAKLYPGKQKTVYVGDKKYLITVKQIK